MGLLKRKNFHRKAIAIVLIVTLIVPLALLLGRNFGLYPLSELVPGGISLISSYKSLNTGKDWSAGEAVVNWGGEGKKGY